MIRFDIQLVMETLNERLTALKQSIANIVLTDEKTVDIAIKDACYAFRGSPTGTVKFLMNVDKKSGGKIRGIAIQYECIDKVLESEVLLILKMLSLTESKGMTCGSSYVLNRKNETTARMLFGTIRGISIVDVN